MSAEGNKAALLGLLGELRKGNFDAVAQYCAPDFSFHSPNFPNWPRGLEGARELAQAGTSAFTDASSTLDDIFAVDDRVVIRMTLRGKYIGPPQIGFPEPGERFSMGGVAIYRFVDGKIVDDWGIQVACPTEDDAPWG